MKFQFFKYLTIFNIGLSFAFATIERGQEIYNQICFNCHGPNLDGGIGPSLVDSYWKYGDSHDAIYRSIAKGVTGTEMIAYELVYSEKDLQSLTEFIIYKQEGNRETLRSTYARDYFEGKRLDPVLFDSIESTSQTRLPENFYYVDRMFDGILRGQSKLYISSPGKYRFTTGGRGRTSIWVNGDEVLYSNDKKDKSTRITNAAMDEPRLTNGLNIVNIAKLAMQLMQGKTAEERKNLKPSRVLPYLFEDRFFTETLSLPKDQVTGFLEYIDQQLPTQDLLNKSKEFELIDYLINESENYQSQN